MPQHSLRPHSSLSFPFTNMKTYLNKALLLCAVMLIFAVAANAQSFKQQNGKQANNSSQVENNGNPVLNMAGKVTVIIIKSAAKTAWASTKFVAKDVAKPLLFKLLPIVTKFTLKASGIAAKRLLPYAAKLAIL